MISVKNLIINTVALKTFTSDGNKYIIDQPYFIMCEYSDNDPSDVIETTNWVLKMVKKGNLKIVNPKSLLPESNIISNTLAPHMAALINYIRENL